MAQGEQTGQTKVMTQNQQQQRTPQTSLGTDNDLCTPRALGCALHWSNKTTTLSEIENLWL